MKQFAILESTNVTVVNVNPRREKHGKTKVPAVDVRCSIIVNAEFLDQLKPELRRALWKLRPATDEADGKLGLDDVVVAVPGMAPVHLEDELTGYTVTFDIGTGRKESIVELTEAKVNSFVIAPHDGGPAKVDFRLQATRIDKRAFGELCMMVDSLIAMKLAPPEVDTSQATIEEAAAKGPKPSTFAEINEKNGTPETALAAALKKAKATPAKKAAKKRVRARKIA